MVTTDRISFVTAGRNWQSETSSHCSQLLSLCLSPIAEICKRLKQNVSCVETSPRTGWNTVPMEQFGLDNQCLQITFPIIPAFLQRQQRQSRCGRLGLSWRLPSPAASGDHPTNEAEQIVDNSVVQRSVIVLKSGMPFRTGEQVSKT